jgi:hypothetical protein
VLPNEKQPKALAGRQKGEEPRKDIPRFSLPGNYVYLKGGDMCILDRSRLFSTNEEEQKYYDDEEKDKESSSTTTTATKTHIEASFVMKIKS